MTEPTPHEALEARLQEAAHGLQVARVAFLKAVYTANRSDWSRKDMAKAMGVSPTWLRRELREATESRR